jgi:predicted nucleotidyltransferase
MYLDRVLGSRTKVNALAVLVMNSEKGFLEVELAREAGSSVSEINRQMRDLVNSGLVGLERVGKGKVYKINHKHFLFRALRGLFRELEAIYKRAASDIVGYVTKRFRIQTAILFGSLAKGSIRNDIVSEPSDIDIAIVAPAKSIPTIRKALVSYVNSEIADRYGISVYPIVVSAEQYVSGLRQGSFISDIHANGEVLYGEKPRRFS